MQAIVEGLQACHHHGAHRREQTPLPVGIVAAGRARQARFGVCEQTCVCRYALSWDNASTALVVSPTLHSARSPTPASRQPIYLLFSPSQGRRLAGGGACYQLLHFDQQLGD